MLNKKIIATFFGLLMVFVALQYMGGSYGIALAVDSPAVTTPAPTSSGQITDTKIPGVTTEGSEIIKCGRPGQDMCTLCDLIAGMNNIIQYLMKIAIGVALLAMAIGGVMYIVSAGDSGLIDNAKSTMKNAAIGFVIIFAGYLIINTIIVYIGAKKTVDASGAVTSMFGMNITGWGNFDCNRREPVPNAGVATNVGVSGTGSGTTVKKLEGQTCGPKGSNATCFNGSFINKCAGRNHIEPDDCASSIYCCEAAPDPKSVGTGGNCTTIITADICNLHAGCSWSGSKCEFALTNKCGLNATEKESYSSTYGAGVIKCCSKNGFCSAVGDCKYAASSFNTSCSDVCGSDFPTKIDSTYCRNKLGY